MNKRLLVGMFSAFMAMAPLCGNAATQSIDAPHLNLTDGCENCHFAGLAPGDCTTNCHKSNVAPYADTVSPLAITHQGLECQACHNPHVSLQAAGTPGAFTGVTYDSVNDKSTLTGVTPPPTASWAAKTGTERGMILWVVDGTENASYEVKAVNTAAGTVTVKGNVTTTARAFDLRMGQLIAQKVTKVTGKSYIDGDLPVTFPATVSQPFVKVGGGGVCQACHTAAAGTTHWKSDGTGNDHHATEVCTTCHKHDSGFLVTACNGCHQGYGADGVPVSAPGLAQPPTGSATAGAHQVHAVDYAFPCVTCHVGTGMDRINAPKNPVADGKIQIGFGWGKYMGYATNYVGQTGVTYEGTNHTTIATTGTQMTCGTVYCHSDGRAVRLGCATSTDTTNTYAYNVTAKTATVSSTRSNTSPKWDGTSADPQGDAVKCNNCHGYQTGTGALNIMSSGQHGFHVNYGVGCYMCHGGTTSLVNGNSVIDTPAGRALHANGVYDLKGAGKWGANDIVLNTVAAGKTPLLTGEFDPTSKNCVVVCHATSRSWKKILDTETCIPNATLCVGDALVNTPPVPAFTAQTIDPNTVKITDITLDADRVDPVKNLCKGSGFNGAVGTIKYLIMDTKLGNYNITVPMQGTALPATPIVRTYRNNENVAGGEAQILDDVIDPNAPRVFINFQSIDNAGASVFSGWKAHLMTAVDPLTTNYHPLLEFTAAATRINPTTCTLTITDQSVDPDANDPGKFAYFGGGHDGSNGRARISFLTAGTGVDSGIKQVPYSNVPLNTPVSTTMTCGPGGVVWYQYFIRDNHYVNAAAQAKQASYTVFSGYKKITCPQ